MESDKLICIVCNEEILCDQGRRYFKTDNNIYEPVHGKCIGTWLQNEQLKKHKKLLNDSLQFYLKTDDNN